MNKKQKIILAIFVPIIVFFIALIIANDVGVTRGTEILSEDDILYRLGKRTGTFYTHDPFDWEKTWYVWMFYLIFCCIFEYKLFADRKIKRGN
ncbi:hypothetical protein ES708_21996 [subsurface metagenome]